MICTDYIDSQLVKVDFQGGEVEFHNGLGKSVPGSGEEEEWVAASQQSMAGGWSDRRGGWERLRSISLLKHIFRSGVLTAVDPTCEVHVRVGVAEG